MTNGPAKRLDYGELSEVPRRIERAFQYALASPEVRLDAQSRFISISLGEVLGEEVWIDMPIRVRLVPKPRLDEHDDDDGDREP